MLKIESRHELIIKEVLSRYPYTFYVFGSRAQGKAHQYSDLDLCFFEDIPYAIRALLREDFENSNLPYTVDFIDWQRCDRTFRYLVQNDLICIQSSTSLRSIVSVFESYFSHLADVNKCSVRHVSSDSSSVISVTCNVHLSMINFVCKASLDAGVLKEIIHKLMIEYQTGSFCWLVGPADTPVGLGHLLLDNGFKRKLPLYIMVYTLHSDEEKSVITEEIFIQKGIGVVADFSSKGNRDKYISRIKDLITLAKKQNCKQFVLLAYNEEVQMCEDLGFRIAGLFSCYYFQPKKVNPL